MSMEILQDAVWHQFESLRVSSQDSGGRDEFFTAVLSEPLLDISFGTSALAAHFHPRNIERVSMEKAPEPAAQLPARQFTGATYFRLR
jgi:hypothetical protein